MLLPKIKRIVIKNFSLYKSKKQINIDLNDGVMCLAGANGLGKSTFISIVSYAMTGYVIKPGISFKSDNSIAAFVKRSAGFAYKYFEGRISEEDRDMASVSIEFDLAGNTYTLKRGFFDSSELDCFSRVGSDGVNTVNEFEHLLEQYERFFIEDAGLASFDQFVFIQGFVLTFDESKKLLFWDADSMNRVMYLFFSVDPKKAQRADELRKEIKRCESRMRNIQWDITQTNKQLESLQGNSCLSDEEVTKIELAIEEEKKKEGEINELQIAISDIEISIKDAASAIDDCVIQRYALKTQYDETFSSQYQTGEIKVETNDRILQYIRRIIVALTEDEGADVSQLFTGMKEEIVKTIKMTKVTTRKELMERLQGIDKQLSGLDSKLKILEGKVGRLKSDRESAIVKLKDLLSGLEAFRKENDAYLRKREDISRSEVNTKDIEAHKIAIAQKIKEKDEEEKKRNEMQEQLLPLEEDLKKTFAEVSGQFIPTFKSYAKSFIGMDIDIDLVQRAGVLSMYINVNGSDRREQFQLSESQQYFLDIALRFALIEYSKSSDAYMLIDTPEGSLDIAYESRAGQMFADFVAKEYSVIMTANINTSHLLLRMAEKCGKNRMSIERMTDWTELSLVQQEEQGIIEGAFDEIEKRLEGYAS